MSKTKLSQTLLLGFSLAGVGGCATADEAPANKAEENEAPVDGKLDGSNIVNRGELVWSAPANESSTATGDAALSASQRAVAWTFALSDDATVGLSLGKSRVNGRDLDTVMYLYQQGAEGTWGRYIERNDDTSERNLWSTIRGVELGAGHFRVVVKGYSRSEMGTFRLSATCTGPGCDQVAEPADFEAAFNALARDANYTSESDYSPQFVSGPLSSNAQMTLPVLTQSLENDLTEFFAADNRRAGINEPVTLDNLRFELWLAGGATDFLDRRCEDSDGEANIAAWRGIRTLFTENLTDLTGFKVGRATADDDGVIQENNGLYAYVIVGRNTQGALVGFLVGSVET